MALPKNFQQTLNLSNRIKSLNELLFFNYTYSVKLTNKTFNDIFDNNKPIDLLKDYIGEIKSISGKNIICNNRISALNKTKAENKLHEWLEKSINIDIIESYTIIDVEEKTFNQEIEDKNLKDFLTVHN